MTTSGATQVRTTMDDEKQRVLLPTTGEAVRLAKTLIRTARHGALAVLEPGAGAPLVSRVGVSSDIDGVPVTLVSRLAPHTGALLADPRCSLLLGEPGKGDPLAYPRVTLHCYAHELEPGSPEASRVKARYLHHQPKASLYTELGDFRFFRLEVRAARLNGGFGRAYAMTASDVLVGNPASAELAAAEADALAHMNDDHADTVALYARHFAGAPEGKWRLIGIDAEGFELADGDDVRRVFFDQPLMSAADLGATLMRLAASAREIEATSAARDI
jgi:putative heme iron utilization protein